MEIRNLKASDMGIICKIMTQIGIREFKNCFDITDLKDKKNVEQIGLNAAFDVAGIILENIPKAQKDIDTFLASLTGQKPETIQNLSLGEYGELIVTVIQKDDFKDFFGHVLKLFNR